MIIDDHSIDDIEVNEQKKTIFNVVIDDRSVHGNDIKDEKASALGWLITVALMAVTSEMN